MTLSQGHNLPDKEKATEHRFGIRVTLPPGDSFRHLLGEDWQVEHWYADRASRDRAMQDMARRHRYSRIGDDPRIVLEAIER